MSTPQDEFKAMVVKYVELCDRLDELAPLRKAKTQLMKQITAFMKTHDISQCNLRDGGALVLKQAKSAGPVNKDLITKQLATHVGPEMADKLASEVWSNRDVTLKEQLRRVKKDGDETA